MRSPIKSLLNIKIWREDEAKSRFAILLRELAAEEKRLYDLEEEFAGTGKKMECDADELVDVEEIKRLNNYMERVLVEIHKQRRVISDKAKHVEIARNALVEASKEKKVFEKLDEKNTAAVKKEFERKEQIGTDEHAVTGHNRKSKG
ncbi:MAG: flagellar export protein FliJ [Nitrospirae bacterium]|nr:flagellar export protein FliJ [Nitrospirota bacterium]